MPARINYLYMEPADPEAEKACRLTRETAAARAEPPEDFFASASDQKVLPNGYELRFATMPNTASRIDAFIAEERECCPFFAFERWEEGSEYVLRILNVDDEAETAEALPRELLEGARKAGMSQAKPLEGAR